MSIDGLCAGLNQMLESISSESASNREEKTKNDSIGWRARDSNMAYRAASVANELLDLSEKAGKRITQIEIQKLVYFAHGWNLALFDQPLIGEQIEAWKYGPVVRSLYGAFRDFGSDPITEKATDWEIKQGKFVSSIPTIQSADPVQDGIARSLVEVVWNKYGSLAPFKLVEITHLPGSPWQVARLENKTYIPNDGIKNYFKGLTEVA